MMNVKLSDRNVYENFDLESEVLYFKLGIPELVSFHGRNYTIKKRMSAEQIKELTRRSSYYQVNSNCFINLAKIKTISGGTVYFSSEYSDSKQLPINRRKQFEIEQLLSQRSKTTRISS